MCSLVASSAACRSLVKSAMPPTLGTAGDRAGGYTRNRPRFPSLAVGDSFSRSRCPRWRLVFRHGSEQVKLSFGVSRSPRAYQSGRRNSAVPQTSHSGVISNQRRSRIASFQASMMERHPRS
jgi:hypothetical protein